MRELADYYRQQKDTAHLQTLRKSLFRDYNFREKYLQADSILNEIQRTYIHQCDSNGILWTYSMKARLHESGGRIDSALYYIHRCMASEKTPSKRKYRHYQKAQLLMKIQAYTEAEALLDSARYYYDVVAKSENLFLASEAIYHLSRLAETDDDPEKAYLHHQDATSYIDQVYRAYQSQAKNNAFNELKWQSEIDNLKISRQRYIITALSLVLALSLLIASGISLFQRKKRKEMEIRQIMVEKENQLLRQAEELSQLREKASTLREELIRKMDIFKKVPSLQEEPVEDKQSISLTKEDWKEIKSLLDSQYDQFTTRLKKLSLN